MSGIDAALQRIKDSPSGPQVGAFFDFDGTLIDGYSAMALFKDRIKRRDMKTREILDLVGLMRRGDLSDQEFRKVMGQAVLDWVGRSDADMRELWKRLFNEQVGATLFPEGWKLVREHQRKGHTVAIASSATPWQIEPLAEEYGIGHILCTRPKIRNGRLTGGIVGDPPWGQGKAAAVRSFAEAHGVDLTQSFGYANGNEDIPFLQTLGHPNAVQPKPLLEATATQSSWPILRFEPRRRSPRAAFARTAGAYAAMGATALVGLGYARAVRNDRRAVDFVTSVSTEAAMAILGVEVKVVAGEEHLWAHRPCVFIINHQSKFDMFLMMYLVRRGFTGVAKKEAAKVPGFATYMRMAEMAFLDRANSAKAIEALKPAVAVLKKGLSVCIAPEGTRSWTPRMNKFKKGAFHMAMQAGVPVVPVVIRNAGEIMGRNDQAMRAGAIEVAVLPAVDVSGWQAHDMDAQVEAVRQQMIHTLEHWPGDN